MYKLAQLTTLSVSAYSGTPRHSYSTLESLFLLARVSYNSQLDAIGFYAFAS